MLTRLPSIIVRPLAGLMLLWPIGCGPVVDIGGEAGSSGESAGGETSTSGTPQTSTTFVPTATTATTSPMPPPPMETTSTSSDMTTGYDPTSDPCGCGGLTCHDFCPPEGCPYYDPDCVGVTIECSVWDQDCASGEKCMPWANDESPAWNATRCVPLDPAPDHVRETCTVEGSATSGFDSCGLAELCFGVDDDGNGTCVSFCGGTENVPVCPEGQACSITNVGVLALCLPACDPLMPACAEGDGCFPVDHEFVCLPASNAGIVSPGTCYQTGGCEAGTVCLNPEIVPNCEEELGCCSPWCDLSSPQCPLDTDCLPWFKRETPPEFENLGICASLP